MAKYGSSDSSAADGKKQRKSVTLEKILDVGMKVNMMNSDYLCCENLKFCIMELKVKKKN
jgi:hypothetical protein